MQIIEGIRNTIIVREFINISFESTKFFHTSISDVLATGISIVFGSS
jgi:hypothetical protein